MAKALAEDGYLTAEHHILYAILRNRDYHPGFPPRSSIRSLGACKAPGGIPEPGIRLRWAIRKLFGRVDNAESSLKEDGGFLAQVSKRMKDAAHISNQSYHQKVTAEFLEPFGGSVTPEMLIEVYDDHFDRLW